ncbi:hypothetical protein BD560DRAFT_494607 [Blakeslea trispora]|nr:hypothetical protein BD560DRAFT_494607 [Blakeslea trispora]
MLSTWKVFCYVLYWLINYNWPDKSVVPNEAIKPISENEVLMQDLPLENEMKLRSWQTNHDFYGTRLLRTEPIWHSNSLAVVETWVRTHLFQTTANEFRLMHSLPQTANEPRLLPQFPRGKQIRELPRSNGIGLKTRQKIGRMAGETAGKSGKTVAKTGQNGKKLLGKNCAEWQEKSGRMAAKRQEKSKMVAEW